MAASPAGGRPLGAAVSVPRGWRVFETQRWRAQSRRQKLRRRALKGRPPRKENLMPPPFQCRNRPSRGDITIGARALFEASHPPHAAQMEGRSRGTPPTRPAAVRPWPPASAAVPLDRLRRPRKFTALGFSWAFFGANPPRKNAFSAFPKIPRPKKELP